MVFLWIFAVAWCGVSLIMLGVAIKTSEPWYVLALLGLFVLIGIGLAAGLVTGIYQRFRRGPATLGATPNGPRGGDTITFTLHLDRDEPRDREIVFALEAQENDEGWNTQQTMTHVAKLHGGMRQASAQFTLPHNARATSASWRWRASARVNHLKYAPVEQDVVVRAAANANEPSTEAVTLNSVPADSLTQAESRNTPPGAHEIASGVWQWHSATRTTQIIGLILITFSVFWLWNTTSIALPRLSARGDFAFSWGEVAVALFGLPFLLVGLLMMLLGVALLTLRQSGTIRRGEFQTRVTALGRTWSMHNLRASDIDFLQAASGLSSGRNVLRYDLAARTPAGAVILPYSATSTNDLMQQARWTASVMGIERVQFDPQTLANDMPRLSLASDVATRQWIGKWIAGMMKFCIALAVAGFALLWVTSPWKNGAVEGGAASLFI